MNVMEFNNAAVQDALVPPTPRSWQWWSKRPEGYSTELAVGLVEVVQQDDNVSGDYGSWVTTFKIGNTYYQYETPYSSYDDMPWEAGTFRQVKPVAVTKQLFEKVR